jgi:hypothetical protein
MKETGDTKALASSTGKRAFAKFERLVGHPVSGCGDAA